MTGLRAEVTTRPTWLLVAGTPVFVLLAHYAAVLPHEFVHSFAARVTGIKADPWDIHGVGGGIGNALLLYNIDEKIDYESAYAGGHGAAVAIAVIAGPGTNGLLYLVARFGLPWWRTSSSPSIAYLQRSHDPVHRAYLAAAHTGRHPGQLATNRVGR